MYFCNRYSAYTMKTIKYILFFIAAALFFSSCESKQVRAGREAYMRYYKRFVMNKKSINIIDEKYEKNKEKLVVWTVVMECLNAYGETVRDTNSFITKNKRVIVVDDEPYFDDMIEYK